MALKPENALKRAEELIGVCFDQLCSVTTASEAGGISSP